MLEVRLQNFSGSSFGACRVGRLATLVRCPLSDLVESKECHDHLAELASVRPTMTSFVTNCW
ncbi:hypothetical protein Micbo1qcDRAFT_162814, partial [Microdochium bolleyi]